MDFVRETADRSRNNAAVVAWNTVRDRLALARRVKGLTKESAFARKIGVGRSTVQRVEQIGKFPDYKPTLEIIEAWVMACDLTLSQFFSEIEHVTRPVTSDFDTVPPVQGRATAAQLLQNQTRGGEPDVLGRTVSAALIPVLEQFRALLVQQERLVRRHEALNEATEHRAIQFARAQGADRDAAARLAEPERSKRVARDRRGKARKR